MQASSVKILQDGQALMFKVLPPILLKRTQLSAMFKCCGLLWQLHLMFGSTHMRSLLGRVRGVISDMGTESLLARMNDLLPDFNYCLRLPPPRRRLPCLLPRALVVPGWRHKIDLLVRTGCNRLRWWPLFLKRIKNLISLFRDEVPTKSLPNPPTRGQWGGVLGGGGGA